MFQKPADKVVFADDRLEQEFEKLPVEGWLSVAIKRTINNLKQNAFCGERIPKYLIPSEYIKNMNWITCGGIHCQMLGDLCILQ